jgi:transcriptional regulator with XRE-family HTH domain
MAMIMKQAKPMDRHVGTRIRAARMGLGMSQEKLGDALGLTFQQVQKYEKGTNRVGSSRLADISRVLEMPVSYFFDGGPGLGEQKGSTSTCDTLMATHGGAEMAEIFLAMTPRWRTVMLGVARAYRDELPARGRARAAATYPSHHATAAR